MFLLRNKKTYESKAENGDINGNYITTTNYSYICFVIPRPCDIIVFRYFASLL